MSPLDNYQSVNVNSGIGGVGAGNSQENGDSISYHKIKIKKDIRELSL